MIGPINFAAYVMVALIFIPLERLLPLHKRPILRKHWGNDLANLLFSGILIQFGLIATVSGIATLAALAVPAAVPAAVRAQPIWLQAIEGIIAADIGFYLAHLTFHKVPFLWRFHAVHHSIEELDWLAAYRVHPIDQILTKTASMLPIFMLGFSNGAIAILVVIYQWQSILIHSNSRVKFGPLKWILASPQFHHWHHANEPQAFDKNFAGQLAFLDWMGGTLHLPRDGRDMPVKYGTDDPVPTLWHKQMLYPLWRPRPQPRQEPGAADVAA